MTGPVGYGADDVARWVPEADKRAGRTDFERDRARVLHSAALRRLAATTQVMVAFESDFPRTRLTHSLECAQIGRELGASLGADPDLVEAACLAHDLGHPPFGHNGEQALDEAAAACGGFEGNAQSFRILSRLEAKVFTGQDGSGRSAGLNLTRAVLDGATKYPWPRREGTRKFGVYDDDLEVFTWARQGAPEGARCLEAQVMDWADDVAYSVHDLEDGLHAGLIDLDLLADEGERHILFSLCAARYATDASFGQLAAALDRLRALPFWPHRFDGSQRSAAELKNLTSQLIGRFCSAAQQATRELYGPGPLTRYAAGLVVPDAVRHECAVLKAVTALYVMEREGARDRLADQRELVLDLVRLLTEAPTEALPPAFRAEAEAATSDAARLRVVIDVVASLTDPSAVALHSRLSG